MGEVIRKTAAVDDILTDVRLAHERSIARPGTAFFEAAEAHLTPVLRLIDQVEAEYKAASAEEAPLVQALEVADETADAALARNADIIWNAIGRPRSDASYSMLFPSGISGYVDADVLDQPARMELLVKLLRSGVHPKLPQAIADAAADEIEAAAKDLDEAAEAIRKPRARADLLRRTRIALARSAAVELSRMKRILLAKGQSESEIHEIIPDRPRPNAKNPATPVSQG